MAVYNTKEFLREAIESILCQNFTNFEFIIIDDASTDGSYDLIQEYARTDWRIRCFQNHRNMWIAYTRNRLVEKTTTKFIATQDSDDISIFNRLSLQYEYLISNDCCAVVWGDLEIINSASEIIWRRIYHSFDIPSMILKRSPLANPAAMFRKELFLQNGGYSQELNYWEDYDLWVRFHSKWYSLYNLHATLVRYRIRHGQTKSHKLKATLRNTIFIQWNGWWKYKIKPSPSDFMYWFMELCLLVLPSIFVLRLFYYLELRIWKLEF